MAYTRGDSKQIIVGAAALFMFKAGAMAAADLPVWVVATKAVETLSAAVTFRNLGYTTNGIELSIQPDFGEVKVDQQLDVARLFKQSMQVSMKTTLSEATLDNLVLAISAPAADLVAGTLTLNSGALGDAPVEKGLVAVGPSVAAAPTERIYMAYRGMTVDSVSINAKRDEASQFDCNFRLLPDNTGAYGKIIDRVIG
jgi:stage V sporulation protein SpoVS